MDSLKKLVRLYDNLTDDSHQQYVGEFWYEKMLIDVRSAIRKQEKMIKFELIHETSDYD